MTYEIEDITSISRVTPARLETAESARRFALAGNARVTLSSARTGARYTYRFRHAQKGRTSTINTYFVSWLTGPDNDADYTYLGVVDVAGDALNLRRTAKSKLQANSAVFLAAKFFCDRVLRDGAMPAGLEVRHEGRCGRCGRALTTPESVDRGIGPECWGRINKGD
jgi:hypothetical protein